jgi:thiamine biosynthesis lipoprotein ApbE
VQIDAVEAVLSFDSFEAIGTVNRVVVDGDAALPDAMSIVKAQIKAIDEACSRFREDSELSRLNQRGGGGDVELSPLLEEALVAALHAAEMTDGLVDPTVGKCVEEAGYTVTFRDLPPDGPALRLRVRHIVGWRAIAYDPEAHTVRLPEGVALDLGASGKAWAADRAAAAVAKLLGVSVAVECGGDIAVCGPQPEGGWPVRVAADADSDEWQDVVIFDGGLATSGTTSRSWRRGGVDLHHIIDPATGRPAETPWVAVSVAAASCLEANAAATAALIMGDRAPAWLDDLKLPARLVDVGGNVRFAGGWRA